jgi:hypothetical protein
MDIPEISGMKYRRSTASSSCSVRLARRASSDFRIYTGNDLGINIEYGSDYLLAWRVSPLEKFAERDRKWRLRSGVLCAWMIFSTWATWLFGRLFQPTSTRGCVPAFDRRIPHPTRCIQNPKRPAWEQEILRDCARRLGCG